MAKQKLYTYAVLYHEKVDDEINTRLLIKPTDILSKDDKTAAMLVARALPEEVLGNLEDVQIIIRPF